MMRHWLVGFVVVVCLLVLVMPAFAQESPLPGDEAPPGESSDLLETLVFLAGLTAAIVELLKPAVKKLPIGEQGHDLILRILGFGFGVAFVVGGGARLNLLALSPVYGDANPAAGLLLTGLIVGGFSQGIYLVGSGLLGKPIKAPEPTRYLRE